MTDPTWITEARKHIGEKEIPGAASSAWIHSIWLKLKGGAWMWKAYGGDDSKLPWCGAFVAFCLKEVEINPPDKYASAREWAFYGTPLVGPIPGCIVVFSRDGCGHVGFVVGVDEKNRLMVLGGNQGDSVKISPFERNRVVSYRWPETITAQNQFQALPIMRSKDQSSANEA